MVVKKKKSLTKGTHWNEHANLKGDDKNVGIYSRWRGRRGKIVRINHLFWREEKGRSADRKI